MTEARKGSSLALRHYSLGLRHSLVIAGRWSLVFSREPLVLERPRGLRLVLRLLELQELRGDLQVVVRRDLQVERRTRDDPDRVAGRLDELGVVGDVLPPGG